MGKMITPGRLSAQPQYLPQVDASNPCAARLGAVVMAAIRGDMVARRYPSTISAQTNTVMGKFGLARNFVRATAAQEIYPIKPFSGDFTIFLVGGLTSTLASNQYVVSLQQGGSAFRIVLGENGNNNMTLITNPSGGSNVNAASGGTGDAVYVGRLVGTALTLWKDGILVASATQAASNWSDVDGFYIGNSSFLSNPNANIYMAGYAQRGWTDAEIAEFSSNPWMICKGPTRNIWNSGAASPPSGPFAATLGDATMAAAGQVTDVGAFATTLGNATLAAAGSVGTVPSGTFNSTLDAAVLAAAGTITDVGAFSTTLAGCTLVSSGTVAPNVTGTLASTLGDAQLSASGFVGTPPVNTGKSRMHRYLRRTFP